MVAIKAWLGIRHELPVNVRLFIEFEEEIGSRNLMAYVGRLGGFFDVDAMVLTDCENPSVTTPGFTTSLRGLATANLCCKTTDDGPTDASVPLCAAVSRLLDDDGRPVFARVEDIPDADRRDLAEVDLPGDLPARGRSNAEWAWRQPALTIAALSFGDVKVQFGNNIRASVRMRLSLPADMEDDVKEVLGQPSSILGVRYSILPVEQSILEATRMELDVVCDTGRQAAGHSGLYGSIWADPSCLLMKRISRLGALGERIREISITQADLPALDIASAGPRTACARLSVRVAPGGTADAVLQEVDEHIRAMSSPEVTEELQRIDAGHGGSWFYDPPNCMGLQAADRAYEAVWGKRPVRVGIGGSIPFVALLGQRFGATTPMILNGVLDPASAPARSQREPPLGGISEGRPDERLPLGRVRQDPEREVPQEALSSFDDIREVPMAGLEGSGFRMARRLDALASPAGALRFRVPRYMETRRTLCRRAIRAAS